jgi:AcrR family transcriptional regulator
MPRPKKTIAQLESTRELILDTALKLLQESGPEAITSRAIAEHMGVAHMSLYTYFENQPAILRALTTREMAKWRTTQQNFIQRAEIEDISSVVEELILFVVSFARENPNLYRMAWVLPETGIESPEENRLRMQATVGQLAAIIQIGIDRGEFKSRNPFLAAATVWSMVNMPYILFHIGKIKDPVMREQIMNEIMDAALCYLKTS